MLWSRRSVFLGLLVGAPMAMALAIRMVAVTRGLLVVGLASSGAVFALVGASLKRPLIVGLVFAFGWETTVLMIPGYLKRLSVAYYLQALVPHAMPADSSISSLLSLFQELPPLWVSLVSLTGITVLGLWLAGRAVEKREYVLEQ